MIVCVSPSSAHYDETQNTLRYANRAKNIQTKVQKNVFNVNRHVKDYLKKIDEQRQLIDELMKKQKDFEGSAFAKFQKQSDKKEVILRDAIVRLRSAYDESAKDRKERMTTLKTLKQAEKRISLISSWIAAFDQVTEIREGEEIPEALVAMRKEAVGVSAELEQTRQHCHRKIERTYWTTRLDTALQVGLRQLSEVDGSTDSQDAANLNREYELLKSIADREAYTALLDQEKSGDAAIVQVLLQAHIETVTILNQIASMDEEEAVQAARKILAKIMNSCTNASSQAIRPDGNLPVTEFFAPTHKGTPKRRKPVHIADPSPMRPIQLAPPFEPEAMAGTPMKGSPRRRIKMVGPRKGVQIQFTPKKKSPSKVKRVVRWRDDTENGTLAEFKTPEAVESTPTNSSMDLPPPPMPSMVSISESTDSSPIPTPPQTSLDLKPRSSRFQIGALLKKGDGPAAPPAMASYSSDSDSHSPLREIGTNTLRPTTLSSVENTSSDIPRDRSGSPTSSDDEMVNRSDARAIGSVIKRRSSTNAGAISAAHRVHRRRSPTAANSCSPPNENMFSAGAARRMVKSEREPDWKHSVLSPRTQPIVKGAVRRTTVASSGDERPREGSTLKREPIRVISGSRGSLMTSKNVWR
jgi:kinesin family protein 18/19